MAKSPKAKRIAHFFERYPRFDYDPEAPVSSEFLRLVKYYRWKRGSREDKAAWSQFSAAMGKQFGEFYGYDVYDINAWQALCTALRVYPAPDTIFECKAIIKSKHVNLVDFIDVQVTGQPVRIFDTEEELRDYTRKREKSIRWILRKKAVCWHPSFVKFSSLESYMPPTVPFTRRGAKAPAIVS